MLSIILFSIFLSIPFGLIWCCCDAVIPPDECLILQGTFDGSSSDDPGLDYVEEDGDWDLEADKLKTSSSNAVIRYNTATNLSYYEINLDLLSDEEGYIRVSWAWKDNNNYAFVEFNFVAGADAGSIKLGRLAAGVETIHRNCSITLEPAIEYECNICIWNQIAKQAVSVAVNGIRKIDSYGQSYSVGTPQYFAILTGTLTSFITVDNLYFWERDTEDCPTCYGCCWPPDFMLGDTLPATVDVTLPALDGTEVKPCCTSVPGTYTLTYKGILQSDLDWPVTDSSLPDTALCGIWEYVFPSSPCIGAGPANNRYVAIHFFVGYNDVTSDRRACYLQAYLVRALSFGGTDNVRTYTNNGGGTLLIENDCWDGTTSWTLNDPIAVASPADSTCVLTGAWIVEY